MAASRTVEFIATTIAMLFSLILLISGSVNLRQLEPVDVHTGSVLSSTHSTSNVETKGKSFLTNQTPVTGVQDVITRMKNADQGETILMG
jgi:hypothetical protein